MSNEELVDLIQRGINSADNLQTLYNQNIGMIHKIACKFSNYAEIEDLEQEGFFGLYEATKHYENDKEVKFITYAIFWIKQAMQRYIESCDNAVRIPAGLLSNISKYQKFLTSFNMKYDRNPTDCEVIESLGIKLQQLNTIKKYISSMKHIQSLDSCLRTDEETTLQDTIPSSTRLEDEVIDRMIEKDKSSLWDIVKDNTLEIENNVINMRYKQNMTFQTVGNSLGITREAAKRWESKGLKKLRNVHVRRLISERFEIIESIAYKGSLGMFNSTWTSSTEKAAIKLSETLTGLYKLESTPVYDTVSIN